MALMITTKCPHCQINLILIRNEKKHKQWMIHCSADAIKQGDESPVIQEALPKNDIPEVMPTPDDHWDEKITVGDK